MPLPQCLGLAGTLCPRRSRRLLLRGRIQLECLSLFELDAILGALYDMVEVALRSLVRAGFGREKNG